MNDRHIEVQPLTTDKFRPYGWLLGKATPLPSEITSFSNANITFTEEHIFDPGVHGETQILWVTYRQSCRKLQSLEVHRLCEQAVIPLTGEITQLVAGSHKDGSLNISTLIAFRVPIGVGICMRPGCWHTTRVDEHEVKCVMLTRRSTTIDLAAHLTGQSILSESSITIIDRELG